MSTFIHLPHGYTFDVHHIIAVEPPNPDRLLLRMPGDPDPTKQCWVHLDDGTTCNVPVTAREVSAKISHAIRLYRHQEDES